MGLATVGGGTDNNATAGAATVAGGTSNKASGTWASVPGGTNNEAQGENSFAAGRAAKALHNGAFVWSDGLNAINRESTAADQFTIQAHGGVRLVLNTDALGNPIWQCTVSNGGSWSCTSDRNAKTDITPVDGREILARLATMPVQTWTAKAQDPSIRHIGPMAQDFAAAFGVGEDDTHIATIDAEGVALAAIQGLYEMVQEREALTTAQQAENIALSQRIATLEARLASLELAMAMPQAAAAPLEANIGGR
jgi:hypothetical protein